MKIDRVPVYRKMGYLQEDGSIGDPFLSTETGEILGAFALVKNSQGFWEVSHVATGMLLAVQLYDNPIMRLQGLRPKARALAMVEELNRIPGIGSPKVVEDNGILMAIQQVITGYFINEHTTIIGPIP